MSTHIGAQPGQIAPVVLLPGDPKRAQWIAETFLDDATCYSEVRGMLGFTGTWRGHRVSVQGSGMGQPSMAIYVNELFREYDVASIVRVGSCGALTDKLAVRDIVIASGACTDSSMNHVRFDEQREPGTPVALAEQHAPTCVRSVGGREPRDQSVDGPDPGAGDHEHPRVRVGPTGLEPGLVDTSLPRSVVRVGREVEVREAHGMAG